MISQKINELLWKTHTLNDNFGMTIEQSQKVNALILKAHNLGVDETIECIKDIINKDFIDSRELEYDENTYNHGYNQALNDLYNKIIYK